MKATKKSTPQEGEDEEKDDTNEHAPDELLAGEVDESVPAKQGDN